jgi:hypothetical protein
MPGRGSSRSRNVLLVAAAPFLTICHLVRCRTLSGGLSTPFWRNVYLPSLQPALGRSKLGPTTKCQPMFWYSRSRPYSRTFGERCVVCSRPRARDILFHFINGEPDLAFKSNN